MSWTHDGLAADLAAYLRSPDRMVWTDMQLGPSGSPRPDVYTLQKSYSKPAPAAFEVKVSRSDLRSDTTSAKWQSYLQYAGSVTFAVPDGLCTVADIPDGCGLIVRKAEVWRYTRRPTIQRVTPPFDACMKLLIDGVNRVNCRPVPSPRPANLWTENAAVRKRFGQAVAECARDLAAARQRMDQEKSQSDYLYEQMRREVAAQKTSLIEQAKSEANKFNAVRREILSWLELDESTSAWAVQQHIRRLRLQCDADLRVEKAESELTRARNTLKAALDQITPKDVAA